MSQCCMVFKSTLFIMYGNYNLVSQKVGILQNVNKNNAMICESFKPYDKKV